MKENKSLFVLAREGHMLEEALLETCGEITPDIVDLIEVKETQLPAKVDRYYYMIDRCEHLAGYYKQKADELAKIAKAFTTVADNCEQRMKAALLENGETEFLGFEFRFKLQPTKKRVVIENENAVPEAYKKAKTLVTIDKESIRQDIEKGFPVEGARLEDNFCLRKYVNTKKVEGA